MAVAQVPKVSFMAGHNGSLHMPVDEVTQSGLLVSIVSHLYFAISLCQEAKYPGRISFQIYHFVSDSI